MPHSVPVELLLNVWCGRIQKENSTHLHHRHPLFADINHGQAAFLFNCRGKFLVYMML